MQVRSDLEAIPTENTDQNYVDRWLADQMAVYEQAQGQRTLKMVRSAIDAGLKLWRGLS